MPNIKPITLEHFSDKRWIRYTDFYFAARDMVCAITAQEVLKAALGAPIGFVKNGNNFELVVLQGLEANKNLYISDQGKWLGRYIPHHYLCYPFIVLEDETGKQVLCIDEDSGLVDDDTNESAEIFFDSDDKPSQQMVDMVEFLSGHKNRLKVTRDICTLLTNNKLIKPWQLSAITPKGEVQIQELYCIDEDRLNALSATSLKELRNKDGLIVAYGQLFSMYNVTLLARQLQPESQLPNSAPLSEEVLFGSNDNGTISFDNL